MAKSIAKLNAEMLAEGINLELVKGNGYLYFTTYSPEAYESRSIMICWYNQITPDAWKELAKEFRADIEAGNV